MKKIRRILAAVCVCILMLSVAGCRIKDEKGPGFEYDKTELLTQLTDDSQNFFEMGMEELEGMTGYYDDRAKNDETYVAEAAAIYQILDLRKEVGDYVGFYLDENDSVKYDLKEDKDGVTICATARFEKDGKSRDVLVKYTFAQLDGQLYSKSISYEVQYSIAERMKKAGMNTLMGMGIVIVVLAFLSIVISLFVHVQKLEKFVNSSAQKKKEKKNKEKQPDETPEEESNENEEDLSGDQELVAVITAAIMAATAGTGSSKQGFVVRSIKRVPGSRWKRD